jgi:hypothetical protein
MFLVVYGFINRYGKEPTDAWFGYSFSFIKFEFAIVEFVLGI